MADIKIGNKYGKCPWCERERILTFTIGYLPEENQIWCDYVCPECVAAAQKTTEEKDDT